MCGFEVATVNQQLRTFFHAQCDVAADAIVRKLRDDGAHFCGQVFAVQHFQGLGALNKFGHDFFCHIADQYRHADGHTAFTGRAVGGPDQSIDGLFKVSVGHDDHMVFRAA